MLLGLSLASVVGCNNGSQAPAVAESQARMVVSNQGQAPASMHVTAADEATGALAVDKTFALLAGTVSVIDLTLPAATYTFSASLADASAGAEIGKGSAVARLSTGATTQIQLSATPGAQGAGAVKVTVGEVPKIGGVDVRLDGSGPGAAVVVKVDASSPSGSALGYFWSGACITGVVQGSSTLTLSAAGLAAEAKSAAAPIVHVVVQDATGVATSADVVLTMAADAVQATISSSGGAPPAACLGAQARCASSCNAGLGAGLVGGTADASCLATCGASLATCTAQ
jgi:hypothetical protein